MGAETWLGRMEKGSVDVACGLAGCTVTSIWIIRFGFARN